MTTKITTTLFSAVVAVFYCAVLLVGCSGIDPETGYTSRGLYRTDIKTVCVKMFESRSFRRQVEFDLTSALVSQIELHSPFKVVSDCGKADTKLYGQIISVTERVLTQQRDLDRPLDNQVILLATVTWQDSRSGEILLDNQEFRFSGDYAVLGGAGRYSGARQGANEMAVRIVEAMEQPW